MKARTLFAPLAALASVVLASGGAAQQPPADAAVPALPPQYQVEIIVFANREFDPTEERFEQALEGFGSDALDALDAAPVFDETTFAAPAAGPAPVTPPLGLAPAPEPFVDPAVAAAAERAGPGNLNSPDK